MSDIAIRAENLGKEYKIGAFQRRHDTLRDQLADGFHGLFSRNSQPSPPEDKIWALKNLSLDIKQGEVIGIIGRNGAGKSTLLKIISRITEPTVGRAEIHGRVGSLLEVGTGFHGELTGRENIYLNGAILGMKRKEIDRKFGEIVAFAEIEKFIDTPVKRYSSGMHIRLGFAVAAHLEPEILLVDEVLAVGDAAFQRKCLGRMGDVAKQGRTVLFVSHNMAAIQSLCTKAVVLEAGSGTFEGSSEQAVMKYLDSVKQLHAHGLDQREDRVGGESFRFASVQFLNPQTMTPSEVLISGQPVIIRIGYLCNSSIEDVGLGISFHTTGGTLLCACRSRAIGVTFTVLPGRGYTDCILSKWPLKGGHYTYHLFAERRRDIALDWVGDAGHVETEDGDYYGTGVLPAFGRPGVLVDYAWKCEQLDTGRAVTS